MRAFWVFEKMDISKGSEANFQRAIMEAGFYPEELPPCFKVKGFYDAVVAEELFQDTQIIKQKPESRSERLIIGDAGWCKLARYSGKDRKNSRRLFSIPNPIFYIDIANYLARHRSSIQRILSEHLYSTSHLNMLDHGKKIQTSRFSEFSAERRSKLAPYPIILKVDVSKFYSSIYTHSIPWAMHGKVEAKEDMRPRSSTIYGNRLDKIISYAQEGQTMGIPTGPITSRLVSEIVAIGVEKEFKKRIGENKNIKAVRYVDDIHFGAKNESEAKDILSHYSEALAEFELEINNDKLDILESKSDLEESWSWKLRKRQEGFKIAWHNMVQKHAMDKEDEVFLFGLKPGLKKFEERREKDKEKLRKDFSVFLDNIIRLVNQTNNDSIFVYAIKMFNDDELLDLYWKPIEFFLMKVAVNFSYPFKNVTKLVAIQHNRYPNTVNRAEWAKICSNTISQHAPLGHDDEVSWACWLLKQLDLSITPQQFESILRRCGSFTALIAIDLAHNDPSNTKFDKSLVKKRVSDGFPKSGYMIGNDWILSYEAERLFGYKFKTNNRKHYKLFGKLIKSNVQFYDPELFREGAYPDYPFDEY